MEEEVEVTRPDSYVRTSLIGASHQVASFVSRRALWLLVLGGGILFCIQYIGNRALWLDEAWLALAILERPIVALMEPLGRDLVAPPGFLALVKLATTVLGGTEFALRLVPFLSGLAALFLFRWTANQLLERRASIIALGLFVFSPTLLYYSSELKPYMVDVAVATALVGLAAWVHSKGPTAKRLGTLAIVGTVAVWLSLPSVFVLGGLGLTLGVTYGRGKAWRTVAVLSLLAVLWLVSFAALYFLVLREAGGNPALRSHWSPAFLPIPGVTAGGSLRGGAISMVEWLGNTTLQTFEWSAGIVLGGLAAFAVVVGVCVLYRHQRVRLFFLISPIALSLAASALRLYPFADRMILFLVPLLFLLMGAGIGGIWDHTATFRVIGPLLVALLLVQPLYGAFRHALDPPMQLRRTDDIRPAMEYMKQHVLPTDQLYIHPAAEGPFTYYAKQEGFARGRILNVGLERSGFGLIIVDDWATHEAALERLRDGGRVWFLFYPIWVGQVREHAERYIEVLDRMGTKRVAWNGEGWALLMYDMGGDEP